MYVRREKAVPRPPGTVAPPPMGAEREGCGVQHLEQATHRETRSYLNRSLRMAHHQMLADTQAGGVAAPDIPSPPGVPNPG